MSSKNTAVFGIYATRGSAERAVDGLLAKGFTNAAISVLLADNASTQAFATEKNTKAPEGTTTGVATGGAIGGTLGLLAGIGALAIPGIGPLLAAGPLVATLAGLGVGGAVGGIVGALVGMGIPEYEAKRYEGAVKAGGTLLSVHCDTSEQITMAKTCLEQTGARDIAATSEASSNNAAAGANTISAGGRNTFGNIADGAPLTGRTGAETDLVGTPGTLTPSTTNAGTVTAGTMTGTTRATTSGDLAGTRGGNR